MLQRKEIVDGTNTNFGDLLFTYDETQAKLETIVAGVSKTAQQKEEDDEFDKNHKPTDVTHLKEVDGVPDFWYTSMKNNAMFSQSLFEKDHEVLKHVYDISADRHDEPKSIEIGLKFRENEFFSNAELNLKVLFKEGSDEVNEVVGTIIDWKEGKDITKKKIKKKQKHKKTNETRTIIKTV